MTESQWLKSKNGDDLLSLVHDRLSERKWTLLACGVVRRVLDLLPADPFHEFVAVVERETPSHFDGWNERISNARTSLHTVAADRQRQIVNPGVPDEDELTWDVEGRHTNPAVPLFESAHDNAATAVDNAQTAADSAGWVVDSLPFEMTPQRFDSIRRMVIESQVSSAEAAIRTALALELKARGDEIVDRMGNRRPNLLLSLATDTNERLGEQAGYKIDRLRDQKTRSENVALAHLIREQLGNPFRPFRFDPKWRTETVVALARGIEADRAFDRMPILADALLDADCDDEAILRHCRGTEPHTKEPPPHAVGCWVLDLILERDPELFALPPLDSRHRPQGRSQRMGPFTPPPDGMM